MRERRSIPFERRSALYARYDAQLHGHTRFFAAAASINAVLAKLFAILPGIRSPRSFDFLNEVGAALEMDNRAYARSVRAWAPGPALDQALVCGEQGRLQHYVRAHRARRPREWQVIRGELNALLNEGYASSWVPYWWANSARLGRVLRQARTHLDMRLDFAEEPHRILIGMKLIEDIRRDTNRSHCDISGVGACRPFPTRKRSNCLTEPLSRPP